jgi:signal transduction histidine kinase
MSPKIGSGPGNKVIATTLLESLAVRGQAAARDRAARALGLAEGGLAEVKGWLPDDALAQMFVAADADPSLARSVGHRLVSPDATGLPLYGLGLASPEKAYRRVGSLLPRQSAASFWVVDEIGSGSARIHFCEREIGSDSSADRPRTENPRAQAALCALRIGMLEAVPGLYGLLPASVKESSCLAQGGDACRYEIGWQRSSRVGLMIGGGVGLGFAMAVAGVAVTLGLAISATVFPALCSLVFCAAIGQTFDLHRQLAAVAGARRGHLALFEQVDDALASKLDALARADAKLEGGQQEFRADRSPPDSDQIAAAGVPNRVEIQSAAENIHAAAGDLECWFEEGAAAKLGGKETGAREARALVREIRKWAEQISQDGQSESSTSQGSVDLVALLSRAVAAARPMLPRSTIIQIDLDDNLIPVPCEPVQIEQVIVQLLRNAVEASRGLTESPEVTISLHKVMCGVEIAVEDRGVGIEPSEIDEVFDPFFGDRRAGLDEGFGLPVCLRIVERHGGELRIETEDRPGTRVSVLLPESPEPPA